MAPAQDSMAHPDRWIPSQRASNATITSMSPHHHGPPQSSMDSPHKGPVMPQSLPCPHTIMAYHRALWSCQWGLMAASWWGGVGISQVGIYHCRVVCEVVAGIQAGPAGTTWLSVEVAVGQWRGGLLPEHLLGWEDITVCVWYDMDTLLVF